MMNKVVLSFMGMEPKTGLENFNITILRTVSIALRRACLIFIICVLFHIYMYIYIYIYIYIFNLKIYMTKLLNTLLKLLYNTTTTIPRGAKYSDNPEALKKRKVKRKTFKRRPDRTIKKDIEQKINKTKRRCKERVLGGFVVCSRVWKELNVNDRFP